MIGFNDMLCIFMYIYEIQNKHKLAWKLFMYILDFGDVTIHDDG